MYGHPWPIWFQMRDTAMDVIAEAAAKGDLVHYGELWNEIERRQGEGLGDRWTQMPHLLGYVSDHFHQQIGALPTAIVVSQGNPSKPEQGFFILAAAKGYLPVAELPQEAKVWKVMTSRQHAFWQEQVSTVFAWAARRAGEEST